MEAGILGIVRHHVMQDAWPVFASLYATVEDLNLALDTALAVEGAPVLVAAYVLETVSGVAAADAAVSSTGQVKRQKDGAEELEFFQGQSVAAANATLWASRAARLRDQEDVARRVSANPAPELVAWGLE